VTATEESITSPTVSVVMPCFNGSGTLTRAVESVIGQTFGGWELLIVDDWSSDDSRELAQALADGDPRIQALRATRRHGAPAGPRNEGCEQARGRYLAFLDCDDYWYPEKLERQVALMRSSGASISATAYDVIDGEGEPLGAFVPPSTVGYQQMLRQNALGTSTAMYDRDQLGTLIFPECGHEDYAMWLPVFREGATAATLPEHLACYQRAAGSASSSAARNASFLWNIYRERMGYSPMTSALLTFRYAWTSLFRVTSVGATS
jgi:teichuronic acid biosynthesis glycosyltransferase TuaG